MNPAYLSAALRTLRAYHLVYDSLLGRYGYRLQIELSPKGVVRKIILVSVHNPRTYDSFTVL